MALVLVPVIAHADPGSARISQNSMSSKRPNLVEGGGGEIPAGTGGSCKPKLSHPILTLLCDRFTAAHWLDSNFGDSSRFDE